MTSSSEWAAERRRSEVGHGASEEPKPDHEYSMLAVEQGGRLYSVNGNTTIHQGATVGTTVRVNTVHRVGNDHRTYINGSLRHTTSSASGAFYDKLGAYRTNSGHGPITVTWSNLRFWYR